MIRARGFRVDGRPVLLLGLERENIRRLTKGDAIFVAGRAHGLDLPLDVMIGYGESLADVALELRAAGVSLPPGPPEIWGGAHHLGPEGKPRALCVRRAGHGGQTLLIVGLDRAFVDRFIAGDQIRVDRCTADVDLPVDLIALFGESLADAAARFVAEGYCCAPGVQRRLSLRVNGRPS